MAMRERMRGLHKIRALACLAAAGAMPGLAQPVISARSGLVHYLEGRVYLNETALKQSPNRFPQMAPYDVLRAGAGRAEVLISPGAYLRMRDRSSVRMLSESLTEPRFEVLAGSIIVETVELVKGTTVAVAWRGIEIRAGGHTVFRLDSSPRPSVRVFEGQVQVDREGATAKLTKGRLMPLSSNDPPFKFARDYGDSFDLWSVRRSNMIAMADRRGQRSGRPLRRAMPPPAGARAVP